MDGGKRSFSLLSFPHSGFSKLNPISLSHSLGVNCLTNRSLFTWWLDRAWAYKQKIPYSIKLRRGGSHSDASPISTISSCLITSDIHFKKLLT